jgi:histone arginine demethylase JMJD6
MKLKYFLRYMATQRDDSPLYIFDSMYNDNAKSCALLRDYCVPAYFREDLLSLVGAHRRPPWRWFLVGPVRSGTGVHVDPLGTSAWNTLLYGRKRWVLVPPPGADTGSGAGAAGPWSLTLLKGKALRKAGEDDEPIDWFNTLWPRVLAANPALVSAQRQAVKRTTRGQECVLRRAC